MQTIKAIIADDEPELRRYLRSALRKAWPELDICAEADNGPRALALIDRHHPQVAFLDIRKPVKELAKELDPDAFWQIHRGTIVNVSFIDKVSRSLTGRCILKLKKISETLTVSRSYAYLFKQM